MNIFEELLVVSIARIATKRMVVPGTGESDRLPVQQTKSGGALAVHVMFYNVTPGRDSSVDVAGQMAWVAL